jgi:hypothetical protein
MSSACVLCIEIACLAVMRAVPGWRASLLGKR